jgi:hypothetical protein
VLEEARRASNKPRSKQQTTRSAKEKKKFVSSQESHRQLRDQLQEAPLPPFPSPAPSPSPASSLSPCAPTPTPL